MKNYIIVDYASNLADKTLTTFIRSDQLFKHTLLLIIPPWPVGHKLTKWTATVLSFGQKSSFRFSGFVIFDLIEVA